MRSHGSRSRAAAIAFGLALFGVSAIADDGFAKWWPGFQASVAKGDAKSIVVGTKFPMPWELGKTRSIETEADFVAHFATYFPADMRRAVATQKPVSIPGGQYMVTWHARGNEYSLYFEARGSSFALLALSEGPP
jgi:hypothetical protein